MRRYLAAFALSALAGCTVGPDYAGPPSSPSKVPLRATFARAGGSTHPGTPQAAQWWSSLGDATLDAIEARALASSPTLDVARARVRQARASLALERANALPRTGVNGTYLHAKLPGVALTQPSGEGVGSNEEGSSSSTLDFYNAGFDASWEADLFGGQRRAIEAARALTDAALAQVADAQVTLTAEVAQTYVALRDVQRRATLARESANMQTRMLALVKQRVEAGTTSALDAERLAGQLETTRGQLVPLQAQVTSYFNALAVLAGEPPGALDDVLTSPTPVPLPPASVPVGDVADLLRRRPDIRAAERQLAERTAQIGVADAARFPRLSFMGLIGIGGSTASDLFDLGKLTTLAAPMLKWSALDFGRNRARVRQAEGIRDEALATYDQTVLGALRDAEDALVRYGARRQSLASAARSSASASRAAELMQQRFRAGTVSLIDVLDAERQRVASEQQVAMETANMTTDYVGLQKALGLGWTAPEAPSR